MNAKKVPLFLHPTALSAAQAQALPEGVLRDGVERLVHEATARLDQAPQPTPFGQD